MTATTIEQLLRQGRIDTARTLLEQQVAKQPGNADLRRLLARIQLHQKQPAEALASLRQAERLAAEAPGLAFEMGVVHLALGDPESAAEAFGRDVECDPAHASGWFNLGWALRRLNRGEEAARAYRQACRLRPDWVDALFNLGNLEMDLGKPEAAATAYRSARTLAPRNVDLLANLGLAEWRRGRTDEALATLSAAVRLQPSHPAAATALGNLLTAMGNPAEALPIYRAALAGHPDAQDLLINTAICLRRLRRFDEAKALLRHALQVGETAKAWNLLGLVLMAEGALAEAEQAFHSALRQDSGDIETLNNLAKLEGARGNTAAAIACYRKALDLDPGNAAIHSNYLFYLIHGNAAAPDAVFEAHREYGRRQEQVPMLPASPVPPPDQAGRRLKVGYVSPDFCDHAVAYWLLPVLERHDPAAFEIVAYHCGFRQDAMTRQLRDRVAAWRTISHLTADQAAAMIRDDAIDILVDLAGHTGQNALPVFARKPAPIQAAWLGYPHTTGLTRIDYRLTQVTTDPPGVNDHRYTETLYRIDTSPVFRPPSDVPDCGAPPSRDGGRVRFGALNKPHKVTDQVLDTWSRVLAAVPEASLVLVASRDAETVRQCRGRFADRGIDPHRIEVVGIQPLRGFLELVRSIDIALDPFPYGGGTTTMFTLWMGVPIVGMRGDGPASGVTDGMLTTLGLHDLSAQDMDAYVAAAVALARSPQRLDELRRTLRQRMADALALQEVAFVRDLEGAYRAWWNVYLGLG